MNTHFITVFIAVILIVLVIALLVTMWMVMGKMRRLQKKYEISTYEPVKTETCSICGAQKISEKKPSPRDL